MVACSAMAATATNISAAVTFTPTPNVNAGFSWGPDSTRAAFVAPASGGAGVYVANSINAANSTLISTAAPSFDVSWTN